jgi:hypothetical protein
MCRTLIDDGFIDRGFRWRNNLLNRLRATATTTRTANANFTSGSRIVSTVSY